MCILLLAFALVPSNTLAGDGEYYDVAVADTNQLTKKVTRSHMYASAGMRVYNGLDMALQVQPATYSAMLKAGFYGIKIDRFSKVLSLSGEMDAGFHDDSSLRTDTANLKLSFYTRVEGARLALGTAELTRDKSQDEKLGAGATAMEYSAGGRIKGFIFTLSSRLLGYRYKQRFSASDYHGFFITGLRLAMGAVFARERRCSLEIGTFGMISISLPKQREIETAAKIALHINNMVVPVEIGVHAGYEYFDEDSDSYNATYDHVFLSSSVGLRF